jgi:L-histidine Nalpha-methyltransferase
VTLSAVPALQFVAASPAGRPDGLRDEVAEGLSQPQKRLPCSLFYDSAGSELFERICRLPAYYLTRTERALLERRAPEMIDACGRGLAVIEFGSGSSHKTRLILEAALRRQASLHYIPIDISADFLRSSALALLEEYDGLHVTAIAGEYRDGLAMLPHHPGPCLFLFLGSNVGNFSTEEAVAVLSSIRCRMAARDRILIGIDLLKDPSILHAAYNDPEGVTAAFNKNILARINVQLGGRFSLSSFAHHAPFVAERSRIEMRLVSRRGQSVRVDAVGRSFAFREGEHIHTENSHKYTLDGFAALSARAGLEVEARWLDEREWYALLLLRCGGDQ